MLQTTLLKFTLIGVPLYLFYLKFGEESIVFDLIIINYALVTS